MPAKGYHDSPRIFARLSGVGMRTLFGADEANLPHRRAEHLRPDVELNRPMGRSSALWRRNELADGVCQQFPHVDAVGLVRDAVRRDDAGARLRQQPVGMVGEQAVDGNANRGLSLRVP